MAVATVRSSKQNNNILKNKQTTRIFNEDSLYVNDYFESVGYGEMIIFLIDLPNSLQF